MSEPSKHGGYVKSVLVTGGLGLIGSHVCKALVEAGYSPRVLDIAEPEPNRLPIESIEFFRGSTLDINQVANVMRGCDAVVHLAAMLGVARTEQQRLACLNANILGTVNVLEASVKDGVRRVVFASSSEVYGHLGDQPLSEASPLNPRTVYAVSKLACEEYLRAYKERYGIEFTVLRLFNVYGPGQREHFVIPRFVRAVLEDRPPTVYGNGAQIRSFSFVTDIARGIALALKSEAANGEVFNLGNPDEPISMYELARKIIGIAGARLEPELVPYSSADRAASREIPWRRPSIGKAVRLLGYKPRVSLGEGIRLVLADSRARGGIPSPTRAAI